MIIGVDFDGTCVTNKFPSCGKNIGAGPVLRLLQSKGIQLMLWTMRGNKNIDWSGSVYEKSLLSDVFVWASKEKVVWSGINRCPLNQEWTDSNKQFADIYIDDMSLGCPLRSKEGHGVFVDWNSVLMSLSRLLPNMFSPEELSETFVNIEKEVGLL